MRVIFLKLGVQTVFFFAFVTVVIRLLGILMRTKASNDNSVCNELEWKTIHISFSNFSSLFSLFLCSLLFFSVISCLSFWKMLHFASLSVSANKTFLMNSLHSLLIKPGIKGAQNNLIPDGFTAIAPMFHKYSDFYLKNTRNLVPVISALSMLNTPKVSLIFKLAYICMHFLTRVLISVEPWCFCRVLVWHAHLIKLESDKV